MVMNVIYIKPIMAKFNCPLINTEDGHSHVLSNFMLQTRC